MHSAGFFVHAGHRKTTARIQLYLEHCPARFKVATPALAALLGLEGSCETKRAILLSLFNYVRVSMPPCVLCCAVLCIDRGSTCLRTVAVLVLLAQSSFATFSLLAGQQAAEPDRSDHDRSQR